LKYELVLQWPAASLKDYDAIIEIENVLIEHLSQEHELDGHDAGSGQMNIFVHSNNPKKAFNEVKAILGSRDFWVDARVAYRRITKSEYTVLWPPNATEFRVD